MRKYEADSNAQVCEVIRSQGFMFIWPVGQAVKTSASHAGNAGSIPARVTNTKQAWYLANCIRNIANTQAYLCESQAPLQVDFLY